MVRIGWFLSNSSWVKVQLCMGVSEKNYNLNFLILVVEACEIIFYDLTVN